MERQIGSADVQMPETDSPQDNANLLGVAWRQKWLVLILLSLGGGLGYLYFLRRPPVYMSSAQVLIVKRDVAIPLQGTEDRSSDDGTLGVHALLLRSPTIAAKAIEKYKLRSLASFRDSGDPLGTIITGLSVDSKGSGGSTVATLTFKGHNAGDCPKVLDAIINAYGEFLGETYQNYSEETATLISQAKDVLLKELKDKEAIYYAFRQKAPLLWKGDTGANLHESRMAEIETNRSRILVEQSQTRSKIDSIQSALKQGKREAISLMIANTTAGSPVAGESNPKVGSGTTFQQLAFDTTLEETLLLQELGADHPKVKALRTKLELIRKHFGADTDPKQDNAKPVRLCDALRRGPAAGV